jgi:hypothetical protein
MPAGGKSRRLTGEQQGQGEPNVANDLDFTSHIQPAAKRGGERTEVRRERGTSADGLLRVVTQVARIVRLIFAAVGAVIIAAIVAKLAFVMLNWPR